MACEMRLELMFSVIRRDEAVLVCIGNWMDLEEEEEEVHWFTIRPLCTLSAPHLAWYLHTNMQPVLYSHLYYPHHLHLMAAMMQIKTVINNSNLSIRKWVFSDNIWWNSMLMEIIPSLVREDLLIMATSITFVTNDGSMRDNGIEYDFQ